MGTVGQAKVSSSSAWQSMRLQLVLKGQAPPDDVRFTSGFCILLGPPEGKGGNRGTFQRQLTEKLQTPGLDLLSMFCAMETDTVRVPPGDFLCPVALEPRVHN